MSLGSWRCHRPATRSGTRTGGVLATSQALVPPPAAPAAPAAGPQPPTRGSCCPCPARSSSWSCQKIPRGCLTAARTGAPRGSPDGRGPRARGHGLLAEPTAGGMPRPGRASLRGRVWEWGAPNPAGHGGCLLPGSPGSSGCLDGGPAGAHPQGAPLPSALGKVFSCECVLGQGMQRRAGGRSTAGRKCVQPRVPMSPA